MNNEELRTRALAAITKMMESVTEKSDTNGDATIDSVAASSIRTLAEAYATIEKAGREANVYDVIKGMYGTGIKGDTE